MRRILMAVAMSRVFRLGTVLLISFLAVWLAGGQPSRAGATSVVYTVTGLGTVPGEYSEALAINDAGQVAGYIGPFYPSHQEHAFGYTKGSVQNYGTLPGYNRSFIFGLNDAGDAAGSVVGDAGYQAAIFHSRSLRVGAGRGWVGKGSSAC